MKKNIARLRRAKTTRCHIRDLGVARLSVLALWPAYLCPGLHCRRFQSAGCRLHRANRSQRRPCQSARTSMPPPKSVARLPKKHVPPVLRRLHLTVPVTVITVASRPWQKRPAKVVCSSKVRTEGSPSQCHTTISG